jgi:UPF0755 protein
MKRFILLLIGLALIAGLFIGWKIFGPAISSSHGEYFYVRTGSTFSDVEKELLDKNYIQSKTWFELTSKALKYKNIKPGRYKIKEGMSLFNFVRMLRNGQQSLVNFVITKLRTKEDLAKRTGSLFEFDSLQMIRFLNNNDTLKKYGLDSNTVMAAAMPYSYTINWNTTPGKFFQKLYTAYKTFWNADRTIKADSLHLTPVQASTLASIIDEETNNKADKFNIASVYLNRIHSGMPLQADPTVKFAMKNFELRRILKVHTETISPFNTYIHTGLPPGPICTPAVETIDAVLNAPKTDYLYFVASSNFDGSSIFTTNLDDHNKYARLYQQALNKRLDSLKKQ